jgi:two-component system nitrogen regulation sensor histidine kinase NtrY
LKKGLHFHLGVRLLGICFFGCLTGYLVFDTPYWMAGIWTALTTAGLFYFTVHYVVQSERKLTAFLQALGQNDFSVTFSENKTSDDYDLHHAFNKLNNMFIKLRTEKEVQHQLLQIVVEHAAVPLICFDEKTREIFLMNEAAKTLFETPYLQKVDTLRKIEAALPDFLLSMRDNEKVSWRLVLRSRTIQLSVSSRHFSFDNRTIKLVAFIDVTSELAAKEAEAWQKLLRVLTHEISNSAIPLSTLSSYIHDTVVEAQADNRELTQEERQDIMESLRTIDQRSKSLKEFVQNFRSLNQIPEPRPEKINLKSIVCDTILLYTRELENEKIALKNELTEDVLIHADKNLTHQIIINLVKNAIEAMENMKERKALEFSVTRDGHRFVNLNIRDSGMGIDPDEIEQIFIPFYSTKKNGSGIGLSISRQVMQKQKGDISVQSQPGRGSVFTLSFSC